MTDHDSSRSPELGFVDDDGTLGSRALYRRACKVLAGGVSSSGRAVATGPLPYPLCLASGRGARVRDVDGNEYIDYLLGFGSAILGHGPAGLAEELARQVAQGTMLGTVQALEVDLAQAILDLVPFADLVRLANSGTEAVCAAVRAARGYTGRNKVIKFEGHYHGWADVLAVSIRPAIDECGPIEPPTPRPHSRGIPRSVLDDVIVCPWNHPEILRRTLARAGAEVAAIVAEPIVANNACIAPDPGFLELLRSECDRHGIVLIFDEVCTGFRIGPGGAAERFGVYPDLVVYSKALGGGLPISAIAGRARIMDLLATNEVRHGGTYNGNAICAAAALFTLNELKRPEVRSRIAAAGAAIRSALERSARAQGLPCVVMGVEPMFQIVFGVDGPPSHYRGLLRADFASYDRFRHGLLRRGVHVTHSPIAAWFVSAAHTDEDIARTVTAIDEAMRDIAP